MNQKKVFDEIKNKFGDDIKDAFSTTDKKARGEKISTVREKLLDGVDEENNAEHLKQFKEVEKDIVRNNVLQIKRESMEEL